MKQIKAANAVAPKRRTRAAPKAARRPGPAAAKTRPLQKRVLLHPFTVMVLLCAGVLIVGTTWRSFALNLDVTATVPASLPPSPAVITSHVDQQHVSQSDIQVGGTCPPQSYVKLFRDGTFSGVSQCVSNSFQIQVTLLEGSNQLQAQVYNLTDQAGPPGTSLVVFYDALTTPPVTPPAEPPETMRVSQVESSSYRADTNTVYAASQTPTITGWAPPFSWLTLTFHSDPLTCITQADSTGWWSCTLATPLPAGAHTVDVKAVTPDGTVLLTAKIKLRVSDAVPSLRKPVPSGPLLIRADYRYRVRVGHETSELDLGLSGGTPPYRITADWGDGGTTTLMRDDVTPFSMEHTYPTPQGPNKNYTVLVRVTDAAGRTALMQLSVVVKGTGLLLPASTTTPGAVLDSVQHWLWLIWPTYVVVVLMAIGYYLGEREEYQHLLARKRSRPAGRAR